MGVAVADILAGAQLVQGTLAALLNDEATLVEVSMLEAMLDFQFEPLTLFYQDGGQPTSRGNANAAHALVGAPYGLYKTSSGYLALAMGAIPMLGELLNCQPLLAYDDHKLWFPLRDEIKSILAEHFSTQTTEYWLAILEPVDIWCANVFNWQQLVEHDAFKVLDMLQTVKGTQGESCITTRCPIRIDDQILTASLAAPTLGQHQLSALREFF
jgi:crotonobetainyl-CoA:carnitine CoA-transferase CaiB-like acyl-CoA transferase